MCLYVVVCYWYVLVYCSHVLECYSYVVVCYWYVLICYSYVTRMYSCGVLVMILLMPFFANRGRFFVTVSLFFSYSNQFHKLKHEIDLILSVRAGGCVNVVICLAEVITDSINLYMH